VEVYLQAFLTSAIHRGEWTASLLPGKRARGTHWTGGWLGPRAGLDSVAKRKKFYHCPCRESNLGRLAST